MSWKSEYAFLLMLATFIGYYSAQKIGGSDEIRIRRFYLIFSCAASLGLLFIFKYFDFLNSSLRDLFNSFGAGYIVPDLNILLPIGISFFTFHNVSYVVDVYNKKIEPEKSLVHYALYLSFFPQLIAGPILRGGQLLPQLKKKIEWNGVRVNDGLRLMLWGFFKKMVIADNCAVYVNAVYNNVNNYTGLSYLVATYLFAVQIYCDFSGYSDIAMGAARVLGIDLVKNFRAPYFSKNPAEFWRRWHISLSTWLRDYLYISMGGNKLGTIKTLRNLMITMILGGLWHGASWSFLIWGVFHGLLLALYEGLQKIKAKIIPWKSNLRLTQIFAMFITFNLVCLGWVFFRANTLSDAFMILKGIMLNSFKPGSFSAAGAYFDFLILTCLVLLFFCLDYIRNRQDADFPFQRYVTRMKWCMDYALLALILLFGQMNLNDFIYFQF